MDIGSLYTAGVDRMADEHDALEETKTGTLRAGNTGCIINGQVVGACARLTLLRYKGIRYELIEDPKRLMFDAGLSNEDIWVKALEEGIKAQGQSYVIRTEEETPIKWHTKSGIPVTGRPDIVVGEMDGDTFRPVKGLELKLASSLWTCRDAGVMLEPKMVHLMQAGHYSWQLGVPFELWYTNRAEFAVGSGWEQRTFPAEKDMLTDVVEWGERKDKRSGRTIRYIKKVKQFRQGYALDWNKGKLSFTPIMKDCVLPPTHTPISLAGIEQYYETVLEQEGKKKLAAKPVVLKCDGSKASFSPCDYCPLKKICDKNPSYDGWLSMVQEHSDSLSKEI